MMNCFRMERRSAQPNLEHTALNSSPGCRIEIEQLPKRGRFSGPEVARRQVA